MIWMEFFDLNEESTVKDLKRAYAKLIKETRPEEDQDYFMRIRDNYEAGCRYYENLESEIDVPFRYQETNSESNEPYNEENEEDNIDYNLANTVNQDLEENYDFDNENIPQESYELDYDIDESTYGETEEYEDDYEIVEERLDFVYQYIENRFNKEAWREFFSKLSFEQEEIFTEIFDYYIEEHPAITSEIAEFILKTASELSDQCVERLEIIKEFDFKYNEYENFAYYDRERFFRARYLVSSWFRGLYQSVDVSELDIKQIRELAIKSEFDYRLFLNYMLQNSMGKGIKYYLEYYSEEECIEKGYTAYLAQYYYDEEKYSEAYKIYKNQGEKFPKKDSYKIGEYSAGCRLVKNGEDIVLPAYRTETIFEIWKKSSKEIEKIRKRGYLKSLKTRSISNFLIIILIVVMLKKFFNFLFIPISELTTFLAMASIVSRGFMGLLFLSICFQIYLRKKRRAANGS
jgi:hypothetical protein